MRIAILHYTSPPVIGGVERVIADQQRALTQLGHEAAIFTQVPVEQLGGGRFHAVLVHNVMTMPFDLEWTQELRRAAAAMPEIQWFNWVHDVAAVNPYYQHLPWHKPELLMLKSPPPGFINVAVSEARQQDYARATGLNTGDIKVIPNGIDVASVLGLSARVAALRLWQYDLVLFHPTRLIRRKNVECGIRVCAALRHRGVAAVYVVSGAPDPHQADGVRYFGELKALAEQLGVQDYALFAGAGSTLSDEDIRGLYSTADCLFFPSIGEGFGLPLVEATMHRLPIFCSDLPVHREVLGGAASFFPLDASADKVAEELVEWAATNAQSLQRRTLWDKFDILKICQERLEPVLRSG